MKFPIRQSSSWSQLDVPMTIIYPGAYVGKKPAPGEKPVADRHFLAYNAVAEDGTVGIRVPMMEFCRNLCFSSDVLSYPLRPTSQANPPPRSSPTSRRRSDPPWTTSWNRPSQKVQQGKSSQIIKGRSGRSQDNQEVTDGNILRNGMTAESAASTRKIQPHGPEVLRHRSGDEVLAVDRLGTLFRCRLTSDSPRGSRSRDQIRKAAGGSARPDARRVPDKERGPLQRVSSRRRPRRSAWTP